MQFLADLWLTCEECDGRRYAPEVLEVRWRGQLDRRRARAVGRRGARVLRAPARARARCSRRCATSASATCGSGQSSTTLSGGEAQRVKLAAELLRAEQRARAASSSSTSRAPACTPPTSCTSRACSTAWRARGDAVIVIEHHVGLLATCDRLVELGPGGRRRAAAASIARGHARASSRPIRARSPGRSCAARARARARSSARARRAPQRAGRSRGEPAPGQPADRAERPLADAAHRARRGRRARAARRRTSTAGR